MSIHIGEPILFVAMMLFGTMANAQYFWMVRKLKAAGVRTKSFGTHHDTIQMLRTYRALAHERNWPIWPVQGFWLTMAAGFAAGIALAASLNRAGGTSISIKREYLLIWVGLASLCFAFWFTARVIHAVPRLVTGRGEWKQLRDEYVRSDAYLAILGWVGFVVASLLYLRVR